MHHHKSSATGSSADGVSNLVGNEIANGSASSTNTGAGLGLVTLRQAALPNPSLEARPNIKTPGPRSGAGYYPPRGPGVLLLVPPQLER